MKFPSYSIASLAFLPWVLAQQQIGKYEILRAGEPYAELTDMGTGLYQVEIFFESDRAEVTSARNYDSWDASLPLQDGFLAAAYADSTSDPGNPNRWCGIDAKRINFGVVQSIRFDQNVGWATPRAGASTYTPQRTGGYLISILAELGDNVPTTKLTDSGTGDFGLCIRIGYYDSSFNENDGWLSYIDTIIVAGTTYSATFGTFNLQNIKIKSSTEMEKTVYEDYIDQSYAVNAYLCDVNNPNQALDPSQVTFQTGQDFSICVASTDSGLDIAYFSDVKCFNNGVQVRALVGPRSPDDSTYTKDAVTRIDDGTQPIKLTTLVTPNMFDSYYPPYDQTINCEGKVFLASNGGPVRRLSELDQLEDNIFKNEEENVEDNDGFSIGLKIARNNDDELIEEAPESGASATGGELAMLAITTIVAVPSILY